MQRTRNILEVDDRKNSDLPNDNILQDASPDDRNDLNVRQDVVVKTFLRSIWRFFVYFLYERDDSYFQEKSLSSELS